MKLGMPALYEYNTIDENINLAKELNLDFIELNLNMSYCRDALENPLILREKLENAKMFQTLHFFDETDFGSYEIVTDAYLSLLEKYVSLGAKALLKQLNVHLNVGPVVTISGVKNYVYDKEFDQYIKRLCNALNRVREICEKHDVSLVIENVNVVPYMNKTYKILCEYGFMFNFDIGHDNNNGDNLLKLTKKYPLKFKEFHIHDGDTKHDHLCLGNGNIDIKYFKELALKEDALILLEVKSSADLIKSVPFFRAI